MDREAGWLQSMGSQRVRHDWVTEQQTFEYSSEGLKLKLQYFGHLMRRANSLEKTRMLGKIEGKRREWQRMRWLDSILTQWT